MDYAGSPISIKELSDSGLIEGLLAGFDNVDRAGDRLVKGCFEKSLSARSTPLPMLLFHDPQRPVGAWEEWQERKEGLYVKGTFALAASDAKEAYALAKAGALTGLSIGYFEKRASTDQRTGVRTVTEVDLVEGSLVAVPANPKADVRVVKAIGGVKDIADLLREAGMNRERAKLAAGAAWKAITETDEEAVDPELVALVEASAARIREGAR